jgi:hypothetical protein
MNDRSSTATVAAQSRGYQLAERCRRRPCVCQPRQHLGEVGERFVTTSGDRDVHGRIHQRQQFRLLFGRSHLDLGDGLAVLLLGQMGGRQQELFL